MGSVSLPSEIKCRPHYIRTMLALCSQFQIERRMLLRWLGIIVIAKIFWLSIFIAFKSREWSEHSVGNLALQPNESFGYYRPLEMLISEGHYQGMCHMPGLLPFYLPLRAFLTDTAAMQAMIFVQVAFDIFATLCLGILAARIFQTLRALHITYLLACISTFTAVRNNYLLSDSLCISITLLSVFAFSNYLLYQKNKDILLTGIGMCVAVFLRPAMLAVLPGFGVLLLLSRGLHASSIRATLLLFVPTIMAIGGWTLRNQITYDRTVVLLAPLGECQPQITPDFAAIRGWILASGGDYQPWAIGGESHWFFDSPRELPAPFDANDFTTEYDISTLLLLKEDYHRLHSGALSEIDAIALEQSIVERSNRIRQSYITNYPIRYYLLNRIKFAGMILFPRRIDDLPFPSLSEMTLGQKIIKAASFAAIPLLSLLSVWMCIVWLVQRKWVYLLWMCLPMGLVVMHSAIGFVEQRYLASSYPFFLMLAGGYLAPVAASIQSRFNRPAKPLA